MAIAPCLFWICRFLKVKNTQLITVSTETVRMAKSRPRKDQSERSDLPCHIINICYWPYREKLWPRSQLFPIWTDPKPDNNIFIFFSCCRPAFKWVCLRNSVIELAFRAVYKPCAKKKNNERTREYLLDKERCIKEQIYFELLDVCCIYFTSEVLQKCLFRCVISCKVWSCTTKTISVSRWESLEIRLSTVKWVADSEETRQVFSTEIPQI